MTDSGQRPRAGAVVFAVATAPERRGIEGACRSSDTQQTPQFLQTGMGPLDIDALADRLAGTEIAGVVSIGTGAGLAPASSAGTLLLPATIVSPGRAAMKVSAHWHHRVLNALQGDVEVNTNALITVDRVLRTPQAKQDLHRDTGAAAADMESADLIRLADRLGAPFIVLRVVLDAPDEAIPASITTGVNRAGDPTPLNLLRAVAVRPGDIPDLVRLAVRLRSVNATLGHAIKVAGESLLTP